MKQSMKTFWSVMNMLMATFMIFGGIQHFSKPDFYLPFVPDFLVFEYAIIYISGVVEIAIGLLMILKEYRGLGAYAFFILMIIFLPIHIWDVFSDTPAVGSHKTALIRLPFQFLFIAIGWKLKNLYDTNTSQSS